MGERLCPIALNAKLFPEEPALITDHRTWNYREMHSMINGLYQHLETIALKPKSRIAFIAYKTPYTVFLLFALFRFKCIACPLSFREPNEKIPELLSLVDATFFLEQDQLSFTPSEQPTEYILGDNEMATCLLTSGSSGKPKAACHTLGNHFYNALGAIDFFSLNQSSRWLLSLPLFHVGGLAILFRLFLAGGAVVLSDLPLLDSLEIHRMTHLSLVPTQLIRLLREKKEIPLHVHCLLLGGAPIASNCLIQASERGLPLVTTYGMTEMSSIITAANQPKIVHVGKALPYREYQLSSDKEILVRGKTLFSGYWDPASHNPTLSLINGWFTTRDLGAYTEEGDLCILGRKDRLFISGGENIHPEEIEHALCSIPGILAAVVVPIADPEFGMRPVAFIHEEIPSHSLESIRDALKPILPSFKHPVRLYAYPKEEHFKMSYVDFLGRNL
jgi:O-succinylbenzoic acid--CoA ligase